MPARVSGLHADPIPAMPGTAASHDVLAPPSARLESLRGVAAMQVAAFHCLSVMRGYPCNERFVAAAMVLCNGPAAVSLFFVLSGFVLGLSLRRNHGGFREIYARYAVRRVFRIYPTVIVSTVVLSAVLLIWPPTPTKSLFLDRWLTGHVTVSAVLRQWAFIRFINPVTWTLRMELVCSLLLPPALLLERSRPGWLPWVLVILIAASVSFPTVISVVVMPAFFLGYLLPLAGGWWHRWKRGPWVEAAILLLGAVLLLVPRSSSWTLSTITLLEATGAFVIVGTMVYGRNLSAYRFLDSLLVKEAGRVSYSYYIYHPLCLLGVAHWLFAVLPGPFFAVYPVPAALLMWVFSSLAAFPVAWLAYASVEKPFINYARSFYTTHAPVSVAARKI